jgi:hypothetical protein
MRNEGKKGEKNSKFVGALNGMMHDFSEERVVNSPTIEEITVPNSMTSDGNSIRYHDKSKIYGLVNSFSPADKVRDEIATENEAERENSTLDSSGFWTLFDNYEALNKKTRK